MSQIKRIVFDLDNTLIPWKEEYLAAYRKVLKDYNLDIDFKEQGKLTQSYEEKHISYNMEDFVNHFNECYHVNVGIEFLKDWLKYLATMSEEIPEINDTLDYLSKKYELVVLTNWFKESQEKRLEHAGMRKYLIEVFGGEDAMKPNPKSYLKACSPHEPSECLMIGDSIPNDIEGAKAVGMQVFYLIKQEDNMDYAFPTIDDIQSLKRIL